jgi:hypothetical protein
VGGTCDSDGDCAFDATSNSKPICSNGICRLVNGVTCSSSESCAIGSCVSCSYGSVCGECCNSGGLGQDPYFCGGEEAEKICCNHTCIYRNEDTHCGACDVDCTCGGADPYRYCTTDYDPQAPSWAWTAVCRGYYNALSGHCEDVTAIAQTQIFYDYCSTACETPIPCDCSTPLTEMSLSCYASCAGQNPNLTLSTCSADGDSCLGGRDETCCGENTTCEQHSNCGVGAIFCLSSDYICIAH